LKILHKIYSRQLPEKWAIELWKPVKFSCNTKSLNFWLGDHTGLY
jgi:hypothetical protein